MANYQMSGLTVQASLFLERLQDLGQVFSESTDGDDADEWANVRAGTANNITRTADIPQISVAANASTPFLRAKRCFLQFAVPNNLSRLDSTRQLQVHASTVAGNATVVPTSVSYARFGVPWATGGMTATQNWQSVQVSAGAKYISGTSTTISGGRNLITLNELAKYHLLFGGGNSSGVKYITIAIVDYTYDWTGNLPPDGTNNNIVFDDFSDSNPPFLILRKPWFIDNQGNEFSLDKDFAIKGFEIEANQRNRRVPQLPFSTAVKGPASMRFRNSVYQVTTS